MLFYGVPGLVTCPRTCRMHRCLGNRSGPGLPIHKMLRYSTCETMIDHGGAVVILAII